jgi:hypothetical protein
MDGEQFDGLLRHLTSARSRRSAVMGLLGSGLGLLSLSEGEAKRHKKHHKKKKGGGGTPPNPPSPPPPPPLCSPTCQGKTCGDDGCGGLCGTCGAVTCVSGTCSCAGKADLTDCGGGRQCSGQVCATPPTCGFGHCAFFADCCSGFCDFVGPQDGNCSPGDVDTFCRTNGDCLSNRCVGFVCTA